MPKEQPREFVIELTGWKFDYSFWVETNKRYQPSRPYFDPQCRPQLRHHRAEG